MKSHLFAFHGKNEIEEGMLDLLQNLNSENLMKPLKSFVNYSMISHLAKICVSP